MAYENFPTVLQPIFQQNMLERRFHEQLEALRVYRPSAFRLPVEKRNGETMIYSRAGRLVPIIDDAVASANIGIDNGLTGIGGVGAANPTYPFEQWLVNIGMIPFAIDLNVIQAEEVIADIFKQNVDNLAEQCAQSLDLRIARTGFRAYESGRTWVTTGATSATVAVDNVFGFDTAFATVTINGQVFPYGLPQSTSVTFPIGAYVYPVGGGARVLISITGVTPDGTNVTSMVSGSVVNGASGTITASASRTWNVGDVIVAADAPLSIRPSGKKSRFQMALSDTAGIQLVINAVSELRRNNVKPPLSEGTYPCYLDALTEAQFFADPQFQIMTMGGEQSPTFKNGRIERNFGVTFVTTTNSPAYTFANFNGDTITTRRAIVCGERWTQESPFSGVESAIRSLPDMGVSDTRMIDDIVLVTRMPIDRLGQVISQGWYYIGGFCTPTDATITPAVVPTASASRYKRAVVIEVASVE